MAEGAEDRLSRFSRFAFLALMASLGFIQVPVTVFGQNFVLTDAIFMVAAGAWTFDLVRGRTQPIWHNFYWLLLFYAASLLFACLYSAQPRESFLHLPAEIYLLALTGITTDFVRTDAGLRSSILAWLLGTAFAAGLGIATIALFYASPENPLLDYVTYHYGAVPVGHYPRITSTFVSASMFCNYLNVSFLLAILATASRWISKRSAYVFAGLILLCSFFTISVELGGVFLGLGLAYFLFACSPLGRRSLVLTASLAIAVAFLVLSAVSLVHDQSGVMQFAGLSFSPSGRILVWQQAWETFKNHIVTGNGLGLPVVSVLFRNAEGNYSLLTDAHNSYLNIAAQAGVLGLAGIMAITVYLLTKWKCAFQHARNQAAIALGTAFICAFVYQGLTGSFEHARHLWVLIGLFIAASRIPREQDQNS